MQPLEQIRILDLSRLIPGPFATMVLADLGARVDKLEDTAQGDYLRYLPPQRAGASVAFHALNRGKRSAAVDLKHPRGKEAFLRLLAGYDVLFDQFRPGVLARLGLDHQRLMAAHPRLIICALTGYGQQGPLASRAGHDLNYLAHAGLLGLQGPADGPPQVPGMQMADVSGALWCVIAILAALHERERTGRGKLCDIAMTDGVLSLAPLSVAAALAGQPVTRGGEHLSGGIAAYRCYLAKDGVPVSLAALEPKFWFAFASAVGLEPDGAALLPGPHQEELMARVEAVFASRTGEQWEQFAEEHDCCVAAALAPASIGSAPHHQARALIARATKAGEQLAQLRTPVSPTTSEAGLGPAKGEHTRQMLTEAGLGAEQIDELLALGAVAEPPTD